MSMNSNHSCVPCPGNPGRSWKAVCEPQPKPGVSLVPPPRAACGAGLGRGQHGELRGVKERSSRNIGSPERVLPGPEKTWSTAAECHRPQPGQLAGVPAPAAERSGTAAGSLAERDLSPKTTRTPTERGKHRSFSNRLIPVAAPSPGSVCRSQESKYQSVVVTS